MGIGGGGSVGAAAEDSDVGISTGRGAGAGAGAGAGSASAAGAGGAALAAGALSGARSMAHAHVPDSSAVTANTEPPWSAVDGGVSKDPSPESFVKRVADPTDEAAVNVTPDNLLAAFLHPIKPEAFRDAYFRRHPVVVQGVRASVASWRMRRLATWRLRRHPAGVADVATRDWSWACLTIAALLLLSRVRPSGFSTWYRPTCATWTWRP